MTEADIEALVHMTIDGRLDLAEGLQKQIEDLERMRDQILEPVVAAYDSDRQGALTQEQHSRLFRLTAPAALEPNDPRRRAAKARARQ